MQAWCWEGVHPKIVSERLGHANISITLDIYSHVLPGLQEAAVEKFDKIFGGGYSKKQREDVSKMLASGKHNANRSGEIERGAGGIRTLYLLTEK